MTLTRKDAAAAALTALAVLAFLATHEGWGVPLVGDSHRWAAGAILLLGSMRRAAGESRGSARRRDRLGLTHVLAADDEHGPPRLVQHAARDAAEQRRRERAAAV